ncbi:MAG: DNA polymerase III subunit alpha [Deltaproteobacteria bacterium]|nr:MAG: DNA polymerase III subunit alpha [Deltaproteobacteria bacterium]
MCSIGSGPPRRSTMHAELHCHSHYSFLEGASSPEALAQRAATLGYEALALTDRGGVYGMVRFSRAAREAGVRPIAGALVELDEPGSGESVILLARGADGWRELCALLTAAHAPWAKGLAAVPAEAVAALSPEVCVLIGHEESRLARRVDAGDREGAEAEVRWWRERLHPRQLALALATHGTPVEERRCRQLASLADATRVPPVATQGALYAEPGDRMLQDVMTAIRLGRPLAELGEALRPSDAWCLRSPRHLARAHARWPHALEHARRLAAQCEDPMPSLRHHLPDLRGPAGESPDTLLRDRVRAGVAWRYGTPSERVLAQVEHELGVIRRLGFAGYFLVVDDIMQFCTREGILAQGRGSAANSVVCYVLGITNVDPVSLDLLFERFLSEERPEYPDIDVDIASDERERVLQYVYRRHGHDHTAMVCNVITFRRRLAVRETARALGFREEELARIARAIGRRSPEDLVDALDEAGVAGERDAPLLRTLAWCAARLEHAPRHLAIHPGGMIISARPLTDLVPVEPATMAGRTVIQWDKDDAEAAGLCKIDLLGLGMLQVIQNAVALLEHSRGESLDPATFACDDPEVYDMLCRADTVGVFQVESRAQMNSLPRLRPRRFYDLVVQVAIIRPGPIQGEMVHPYIRRRNGEEPVTYLHPALQPILERTLGVPLFQEQGMRIAVHAAGLSPGEADQLRRAMGSKRSRDRMDTLSRRLIEGMARNGIPRDVAERIFRQLAAFADYGFPESHAASFALIVYLSAWLKLRRAPEFLCALLNAQPMGFYSPDTLIRDARRHGVVVRPLCAARSAYDCTLEPLEDGDDPAAGPAAVRIGLRFLRAVGPAAREPLETARAHRPFHGLVDFALRSGLAPAALEQAALTGAFDTWGLRRRDAAWQIRAIRNTWSPLAPHTPTPVPTLPLLPREDAVAAEFAATGLSVHHHALEILPPDVRRRFRPIASLANLPHGSPAVVLGLVTCRQSPQTARGFVFLTLEDPSGMLNVVVPPDVFDQHRHLLRNAPFVVLGGTVEHVRPPGGTSALAPDLPTPPQDSTHPAPPVVTNAANLRVAWARAAHPGSTPPDPARRLARSFH